MGLDKLTIYSPLQGKKEIDEFAVTTNSNRFYAKQALNKLISIS